MHLLMTVVDLAFVFSAGVTVGVFWGRAIERAAVAQVLVDFRSLDAEARAAVNRLANALPYITKLF